MSFNLLSEESWKLPAFNIVKCLNGLYIKAVGTAFNVNGGRGIFLDNVNKLIYFSSSKIIFNTRLLLEYLTTWFITDYWAFIYSPDICASNLSSKTLNR